MSKPGHDFDKTELQLISRVTIKVKKKMRIGRLFENMIFMESQGDRIFTATLNNLVRAPPPVGHGEGKGKLKWRNGCDVSAS